MTYCSSPDPSASQISGRGCGNPFICVAILTQESFFDSAQISESQGRPSQLRVEVTGMYLDRNSLIPRYVLGLSVSPQGSKCPPYQEAAWPEEAVLCHCNQWCDSEKDEKRSDSWTYGSLEPDAWRLVGVSFFSILFFG